MGDMREIVNVGEVERLLVVLAVVGPMAGAAIGGLATHSHRGALRGISVGLLLSLTWIMWHIYNAVTDRLGLDTVKNVFVNLGLFVCVGVIAGLVMRRIFRPDDTAIASVEAATPPTNADR